MNERPNNLSDEDRASLHEALAKEVAEAISTHWSAVTAIRTSDGRLHEDKRAAAVHILAIWIAHHVRPMRAGPRPTPAEVAAALLGNAAGFDAVFDKVSALYDEGERDAMEAETSVDDGDHSDDVD